MSVCDVRSGACRRLAAACLAESQQVPWSHQSATTWHHHRSVMWPLIFSLSLMSFKSTNVMQVKHRRRPIVGYCNWNKKTIGILRQKIHNHSHQRLSVKLKMHQNKKSRPGLRPRPHWGSLQLSPRPPSWIITYRPFGPPSSSSSPCL